MKTLSKKSFFSQPYQFALFFLALVFISSSCTFTLGGSSSSSEFQEPELISTTVFYSPVKTNNIVPVYYVDTADQNGNSAGPETVDIQADITANKAIKSLSVQIRDSSFQIVYEESFSEAINKLSYSIDMIFLINIVDTYSIYVVSSYGDGSSVSIVSSQPAVFQYVNPISDDGGGN